MITARESQAITRYVSGVLGHRKPVTMAQAAETAGRSQSWLCRHLKAHKLPHHPQGWGKRRAGK